MAMTVGDGVGPTAEDIQLAGRFIVERGAEEGHVRPIANAFIVSLGRQQIERAADIATASIRIGWVDTSTQALSTSGKSMCVWPIRGWGETRIQVTSDAPSTM